MDFNPKMLHTFPSNVPVPYFMAYPGCLGTNQEQENLRDLEYLQQTYPSQVQKYQRKLAEILDKLDYEGSMIYDEYPDRYCLQKLAKTVTQMIRKEEEEKCEESIPQEVWDNMENMIYVLTCNEIYKRRHGGKRASVTRLYSRGQ